MLTIRSEQIDRFRRVSRLKLFENKMVRRFYQFAPQRCQQLGTANLRRAIRSGYANAQHHGFNKQGPVRLFLELAFLFGSSFDKDPLYPWVNSALNATTELDEMARAQRLRQEALHYADTVLGADNAHILHALRQFDAQKHWRFTPTTPKQQEHMLAVLFDAHPQRSAYLGKATLQAFVQQKAPSGASPSVPTDKDGSCALWCAYWMGDGFATDPFCSGQGPPSRGSASQRATWHSERFWHEYIRAQVKQWEGLHGNG